MLVSFVLKDVHNSSELRVVAKVLIISVSMFAAAITTAESTVKTRIHLRVASIASCRMTMKESIHVVSSDIFVLKVAKVQGGILL